jgi:hypothetical protein
MAAKIGTSNVLFRVGSGSPSKVFLGTAAVQTVPGAPTLEDAIEGGNILFTPSLDGGSPILGYAIYVDGVREPGIATEIASGEIALPAGADQGDEIEIAAVNAIGEGDKSNALNVG